jgi:phosphoribosylpyrophosphate synthetase
MSIISKEASKIIKDNFLFITASGDIKYGIDAFIYWCDKNKLDVEKTAKDYVKSFKKFQKYRKGDLIDGSYKIKKTDFDENYMDKIFYIDFYSIERFGKTKLGQLLLYAKQSQNKKLIKDISSEIKEKIEKLIKKENIDAIAFIPPTVKREVQFIKELEKNLKINKPKINIVKIKTPVSVPQKTLKKLDDRIENARETFVVDDNRSFKKILLVDDALGSGATFNEICKKIKDSKVAKKTICLAITGSFSGFEVISEV